MLAWLLGVVWWTVLPVRKRLAVANFRAAFPDLPPSLLRRTVQEVVQGYLDLSLGRPVRFENLELLQPPCLLLGGHLGSWDLALVRLAKHRPMTIFVRTPSNPLAARVVARMRRGVDLELLPPHGSREAGYSALEHGRVLAFVQDQRHNQGIEVPFFGRPCRTSAAFAAAAHRTRLPLVGIAQWREADGTVRARLERLDWKIPEDRDEAILALTRRSQEFYEARIREHPEQWWWLHDRWKQV